MARSFFEDLYKKNWKFRAYFFWYRVYMKFEYAWDWLMDNPWWKFEKDHAVLYTLRTKKIVSHYKLW